MKNIIIFVMYCSSSLLMGMISPATLYIENHYGALLFCRTNQGGRVIPSNGDSIKIGSVVPLGCFVSDAISSLAISTTWSGMTSLDEYVEKFSDESDANIGKDAVLMIKPSSFFSSWDIEPLWRKKNGVIDTFSMMSEEDEAKTIERKLQLGIGITPQEYLSKIEENGLFGQSYAHKVKILREINYEEILLKNKNHSTAYAKVYSFGYPSLVIIIGGIKYNYQNYISYKYTHAHDHPGNKTSDEVRDFIKRMIDNQWDLYLQYKANGWLD